jgi:20S proteasome alpha/beta subunit
VKRYGKYRRKERISTTTTTGSAAVAVAIALKFHSKHVTNRNKTKHIMKISHINVKSMIKNNLRKSTGKKYGVKTL